MLNGCALLVFLATHPSGPTPMLDDLGLAHAFDKRDLVSFLCARPSHPVVGNAGSSARPWQAGEASCSRIDIPLTIVDVQALLRSTTARRADRKSVV